MKFDYKPNHYRPNYFCGILPNADESRHEFGIRSGSTNKKPIKKDNIESKLKEEGTGKGIHIITKPSTEGSMQKQGRNYY